MAEQPKLLGTLPSPFVHRVIWALKLKAIPYEFIIEEDLTNKSPLLLKYNPVHKKVLVFLHGDKPVCESMIIVEYIDEVWPQNPLLPKDPYERAQARFWVKFAEDKGTTVFRMFSSKGEELEKTKKETLEMLQTVEEHGIGEKKFFGGESIGIADIAFGSVVYGLEIIEEAIGEGAVFEDEGRAEMSERDVTRGKCFPLVNERKTLSACYSLKNVDWESDGNHFPLTIFLKCCQTLESKETEFLEFNFLETNKA